jgi:sterol desaturase/sphingolipid hydroxylase (fatty acid hydroxylase superfamily)
VSALFVLVSIVLLTIAERRKLSWPTVGYWLVFLAVGYGFSFVTMAIMVKTWPLLIWHADSWLLGALAWLLTYDFLYYWYHRAQHRYAWLWRFHKVHHSITDLSALNSYHHVAEHATRFLGVVLPFSQLLRIDMPQMMAVYALATLWGHYLHSPIQLNFGKLRWLVADNVYHRAHHERAGNYAAYFPLIDRVFGTTADSRS